MERSPSYRMAMRHRRTAMRVGALTVDGPLALQAFADPFERRMSHERAHTLEFRPQFSRSAAVDIVTNAFCGD